MESYGVAFCDWLLSFDTVFSKFIHVACISILLVFIAIQYSITWIYHTLFTYLSANEHLGCFHFSASMNNFARNIYVQVLCRHMFSILLSYAQTWNGIAWSYGDHMFFFQKTVPAFIVYLWSQIFSFFFFSFFQISSYCSVQCMLLSHLVVH